MKKGRGALALVSIAIFFSALIFAVTAYVERTNVYVEEVAKLLSKQASEMFGVSVAIDSVRVASLHTICIEGIRVQDNVGQEIASAVYAEVEFRLFAALASSPAAAVSRVHIVEPQIFLKKQEDGRWNVADLMQDDVQASDFHGKVSVQDGRANIDLDGNVIALADLAAVFDFADDALIAVEAEAKSKGAPLHVKGDLSQTRQALDIMGEHIEAMDYIAFLPSGTLLEEIKPQALHIDEAKIQLVSEKDDTSLTGEVRFSKAKALVYATKVEASQGLLLFTKKEARVFLRALANDQPASIHGKIAWQEEEPTFNFVVDSASFDPSAILEKSPFVGKVRLLASVYGTKSDLKIDGSFEAAKAMLYGQPLTGVKVNALFADGYLTANASLEALGGTAEGQGIFRAADGLYSAHIKAQDLIGEQIAALLPVEEISLQGSCGADVMLEGKGTDVDGLLVYGTFIGEGALFRGVKIDQFSTSFFKQDSKLHLDNLQLSFTDGGAFVLEGDVEKEDLDLRFYGTALPLSLVDNFLEDAKGSGTLEIAGTMRGAPANPLLEADVEGAAGSLFSQPFDTFHASVHGRADNVVIERFLVEHGGKETWIAEGSIGFVGDRHIDLRVDAVSARMEDVAAFLAPTLPITGNVDNTIRFTGTLDNPSAVGYIHFYRGSYDGYILSGMDGDYYLENGVLRLQDFHIFSPLVDVDLNGTISKESVLDLYADVHDVSFDRLASKLPYPVSGHGTFAGHIGGTFDTPQFVGVLDAKTLQFNGQTIEAMHGEVRTSEHMLHLENIGFEQNGGSYTMKCQTNRKTQALDGILRVENGDVYALLAILNLKNEILEGRLDGTISLAGTLENPLVGLNAVVKEGKASGYDIKDLVFDVKLSDHVVTINELHASQGEGVFAAKGKIPLDGKEMDAQFAANGIAAGMLTKAAGVVGDVRGTLDLAVQFSGTVEKPQANASVEMKNGGIGVSTFDELTGLLTLTDGVINIQQLIMQKNVGAHTYSASAKGKMPVKSLLATPDAWLDAPEQLDLTVSLNHADLSLLPILLPSVDWAFGQTKGKVRVTGTLLRPHFMGEISLTDGALKLKEIHMPVTEMNARLRFGGASVFLEDCTGKMGEGSYSIKGKTAFLGGRLKDYELSIKADDLAIVSNFYNGPLTAHFSIEEGEIEGKNIPKLTGQIDIHRATLSIPSIPDTEGELPEMLLDVSCTLGDRVRFFSPSLYDMRLAGSFHYGGTTQRIVPAGTITVERGTISYNKTRFTIKDGEAYFNQLGSFLPSLILEADARFGKMRIFLHAKGPIGAMDTRLTSMPELSEAEILRLLTFQTADLKSEQALTSLLSFGLSMTLLGDLEANVQNALGLDEFSIAGEDVTITDQAGTKSGERDRRLEYNLEIGKYLNDKIMLRYKQGIGNKGREFGVRYDFNDRMSLYWNRDEDARSVVGLEARLKF